MEILKNQNVLVRLSVVLCACVGWILYRIFYLTESTQEWNLKYCFDDKLLTYFLAGITHFLSQHLMVRDMMFITASAFLDIFMVSFLIVFAKKGDSWRPVIHLMMFYCVRGLFQTVTVLEFYDTYLDESPGFPSLTVPYGYQSDFFYSGHAGVALALGFIFHDLGYKHLFYFGIFLSIFESFVMTVIRAHYSIDIIFGVLMAHYFYFLSKRIANVLDNVIPICGARKHKFSDTEMAVEKDLSIKEKNNNGEGKDNNIGYETAK
jgi:hypothetical protein